MVVENETLTACAQNVTVGVVERQLAHAIAPLNKQTTA